MDVAQDAIPTALSFEETGHAKTQKIDSEPDAPQDSLHDQFSSRPRHRLAGRRGRRPFSRWRLLVRHAARVGHRTIDEKLGQDVERFARCVRSEIEGSKTEPSIERVSEATARRAVLVLGGVVRLAHYARAPLPREPRPRGCPWSSFWIS